MSDVGLNSLPFKLWMAFVALAETNAYLMYVHHHQLSSEGYSHADFKLQLEREWLVCAQQGGLGSEEECELGAHGAVRPEGPKRR
jgi:hypothetical protein